MSIEALKEQARRHEQKEEWQKALDVYVRAIDRLEAEEQPDISLYNRAGDLKTRLRDPDGAVRFYEKAVDLYVEADLQNNAIAICKKVIRNLPDRHSIYLKMGQIRAHQGFISDARQSFLTYAERMQKAGQLEGAYEALTEFVALVPEDLEIRLALASQLVASGRKQDALAQLMEAYELQLVKGYHESARVLEETIRELDPEAVLPEAPEVPPASADVVLGFQATSHADGLELADELDVLGDFDIGSLATARPQGEEHEPEELREPAEPAHVVGSPADDDDDRPHFELDAFDATGGETEEAGDGVVDDDLEPLPMLGAAHAAEDAGEGETHELDVPDPSTWSTEEAEPEDEWPPFGESEEDDLPLLSGEREPGATASPSASEPMADDEAVAFAGEEESAFELERLLGSGPKADDGLTASDFGETDDGGRGTFEYVDDLEAPPELDLGLSDIGGADEAAAATEAGPAPPSEDREVAEEEQHGSWEEAAAERRVEDPMDALRRRVEEAPGDAEAWFALAEELLAEGVEAEGMDALEEAHRAFASAGDLGRAMRSVREQILREPDNVSHHQRLVEYAFRTNDRTLLVPAYLELAECLQRTGEDAKAEAVFQQVLSMDPGNRRASLGLGSGDGPPAARTGVASSEEYVDLGAMILEDEEREGGTRWTVTAEEPSGDEEADFARMLSQFKAKVAQNVASDDLRAHYDLGAAYKEMGLLDEAIAEFQQAIRASASHLPSFEMLGQCFLEKDQPEVAARALHRALQAGSDVEDELLGIYYYLGRASEALGNTGEAREFYEKAFALDINFLDVTERLRQLR